MNGKLWTIVRAQSANRRGAVRGRGAKRVAMLVALALAFAVLGAYMFIFGMMLCTAGAWRLAPGTAVTVLSCAVFLFTVIKTNGMVLGCKDDEMLLSLPVTVRDIACARMINLYSSNLLWSLLIMLPIGIAVACFGSPQWYFYPMWLAGMLSAPLLPTVLGAVVGVGFTAAATRFRHAKLMSSVLLMLFTVAFALGPNLLLNSAGGDEDAMLSAVSSTLAGLAEAYLPARLFADAAVGGSVSSALLFVGVPLLLFALMGVLLSRFYVAINEAAVGRAAGRRYVFKEQRTSGAAAAVAKKEWAKFLGTPIYFMNSGVGAVMSIVMMGMLSFSVLKDVPPGALAVVGGYLPLAIPFFLGMSSTTCVSLSLEGKNLWILQTAPLSTADVMGGKLAMSLSLTLPAGVVCSLLLLPYVKDPIEILLLFVYPAVFCVFSGVFGALVNIKLPNFTWENEGQVVKRGASSMLGIFGSMAFSVIPIVPAFAVPSAPPTVVASVYTVVLAAASAVMWRIVCATPLLFENQ